MKKTLVLLGLLMLIVPCMAVNITYPSEYYTLGLSSDVILQKQMSIDPAIYWNIISYSPNIGAFSSLAISKESRRQTILIEKQNELIAEQNELIKQILKSKLVCIDGSMARCQKYGWE